jgi:hypothetical protein
MSSVRSTNGALIAGRGGEMRLNAPTVQPSFLRCRKNLSMHHEDGDLRSFDHRPGDTAKNPFANP